MAQDVASVTWSGKATMPVVEKTAFELAVQLGPSASFAAGQILGAVTTATANDRSTLTATGTPTGGTFSYSLTNPLNGGSTTTIAIPYNATSTTLQAQLDAVYGAGNTTASGGPWPGTALKIDGTGRLAGVPIATPVVGTNAFTGGSTPTSTVAHTTTGVTKGKYGVYASGNSDGTQTAECILSRACQTDANGLITLSTVSGQVGGEFSEQRQSVAAWFGGVFQVTDLTGLDSTAVTAMNGAYLKNSTLFKF